MRVIYRGLGIPTQSWTMPKDRHLFAATWWRIGDAARAWGCTRSTAKRLIDRHYGKVGRYTVQIVTPHGRSLRTVIPADTPRPSGPKGNPNFTRPEYERELALRRWHPDRQCSGEVRRGRLRRLEREDAERNRRINAAIDAGLKRQRKEYERQYAEERRHVQR